MVGQMKFECSYDSGLDVDRALRELQEKTSDVDDFCRIGPFGVLPLQKEPGADEEIVSPNLQVISRLSTPKLDLSLAGFAWDDLDGLGDITGNAIVESESGFSNAAQTFEEDARPIWEALMSATSSVASHSPQLVHADTDLVLSSPGHQSDVSLFYPPNPPNSSPAADYWNPQSTILTMTNDQNMAKVPPDARLLLNYYSSRIIEGLSMSQEQKAQPWTQLHLPCAMSALAEVMIHGQAKNLSKIALFYALLSISAYTIGWGERHSSDRFQYWSERGLAHKKKAQHYLQSLLSTSLPKGSRGKYKELLMSVMSMVTIGVSLFQIPGTPL